MEKMERMEDGWWNGWMVANNSQTMGKVLTRYFKLQCTLYFFFFRLSKKLVGKCSLVHLSIESDS